MTNSAFHYCNGCDGYDCDEDKGCSYPDPRPVVAPQQPALSDYERSRQAVLDAITYVGSDGGIYNSFREAVDLRRYL